jgi:hypothetical protein
VAETDTASAELPPGFMAAMRARVHRDIGQPVERLVPVYDSLYSAAEFEGLLAFYQTPLGRRGLENEARLAKAAEAVTQRWGVEVLELTMMDLSQQTAAPPRD